jgi:hypothetical protein
MLLQISMYFGIWYAHCKAWPLLTFCPPVRLFMRPSHSRALLKRLHIDTIPFAHNIAMFLLDGALNLVCGALPSTPNFAPNVGIPPGHRSFRDFHAICGPAVGDSDLASMDG